jgi:ABC-type branched-subunit amino acid transport system permease subunit
MITYIVTVVTLGVIYSIVCLALNVRWGWAGEFDFFVYGLLALGAYVDAIATLGKAPGKALGVTYLLGLHLPWIVGALIAMSVTSLVSLIVGSIALRQLRQMYFAIMTFSSVLIMAAVIGQETFIFNGYSGVYGVPQPFNSVLKLGDSAYSWFFLGLCVVVLVVVYVVIECIFWSPYGLVLRAIREDEVAAASFGFNPYTQRLKAYVLGGAVAGLAGSLLVSYLSAFNVDAWSPIETVLIFAAIIIGGTGNSLGAVLGSFVVFGVILESTRFLPSVPGHADAPAAIRGLAIALVTLAFLRWRPQGILPERHVHSSVRTQSIRHLQITAARLAARVGRS